MGPPEGERHCSLQKSAIISHCLRQRRCKGLGKVNKFLYIVIGVALVLTSCTSADTTSSQSNDEASADAQTDESVSPSKEPSEDLSPSPITPEPTTYADVVIGSVTTAEICETYSALLDQYGEIVAKRTKSLKGKVKDPYKAANFAKKNGWIYRDLTVGFEKDVNASATDALNTVSDGKAGTVESIEPYLNESMQACGLDEQFATVKSDISGIDKQQASVVTSAGNKPWYPKSYNSYGANLAWKWTDESCGFSSGYCWTMRVKTKDGCYGGLYAEINIEKNGTVIDFSNDSLGSLAAGKKAKLEFIHFDRGAGTLSGNLAELNCY